MRHKPLALSRRPERPTSLRKDPRLESIGENGPLETVLRRQAESGASAGPLIDVLHRDLKAIREQARRITQEMSSSDSNGNLFLVLSSRFRSDPFHDRRDVGDPVLLCAIARIEGLEEDFKRLYDAAYEAFRKRPFEYRDALSELLPKEFADILRRIDYSKGLNATAADDFPVFRERLDSLRALVANRGVLGMPTGLEKLDEALCGLRGITFLCAPTGAGKTTLMLSAARATLRRCDDVAALILSFDESKDRIYQRLLCLEAGTPEIADALRPVHPPCIVEAAVVPGALDSDVSPSTAALLVGKYADGPRWNERLFRAACDLAGRGVPLAVVKTRLLQGARPWDDQQREAAMSTIQSAYSSPRSPAVV